MYKEGFVCVEVLANTQKGEVRKKNSGEKNCQEMLGGA